MQGKEMMEHCRRLGPGGTPPLLLLPLLLLLLACCTVQHCLAFRYKVQSLEQLTHEFAAARRDTVLLLPMMMELHIRKDCDICDFSYVVDELMKVIQQRYEFVQRLFHKNYPTEGYVLSSTRRFKVEGHKFIMYYYVAFLGTTKLNILMTQMGDLCAEVGAGSPAQFNSSDCRELQAHPSAVLYNLILLSSFKFVPNDIPELAAMFHDFKDKPTAGFVVARSSEDHDIHELLCKTYLQCYPSTCSITKVSVPETVRNMSQWSMYDKYLNASRLVGGGADDANSTVSAARLVGLSADQIFDASFFESKLDFGIYRSSCGKSTAACSAAASVIVTLLLPMVLLWLLQR